ncbi:MAG TPA: hypothetical protein VK524_14925 [Polyangiaceae bacterium]|nr:hypothetical protein [Polyangiaceae bacterium]
MKAQNRIVHSARATFATLALVLAATSTTGCYKATFVEDPALAKKDPTHEEWADHYVWGLVGDKDYDVNEWCPQGAGVVKTGGNVGTTALTVVTLGVYAPRKVYVTCDSKTLASNNQVIP